MKIGIIGTGAIGGTIARKLAAAGHQVKVTSTDDADVLAQRASELGVAPASVQDVVADVAVIIMSVPTTAIAELSEHLFAGVANDVIVVDTSNYYPFRDGHIDELAEGKPESLWISEQIGRPVIKAFNNLLAETLANGGKDAGADERIAMAISGDDDQAKTTIKGLIHDMGYDVVDAGELADSWRHQPGTPAYCTELGVSDLKQALADGVKDDAARLREHAITKFMATPGPSSHQEVVETNRSLFAKNPKTK